MSRVVLEGVTKRFGETVAVDNVSLEIQSGEFFCLLGPSGCGKTTLMRCVAGLERPNAGRIWIGDKLVFDSADLTFEPAARRGVGMVFQNYALWPHMTVRDNILFGLRLRKVPRDEQERRLLETMEQLQIRGLEERFPNELSGGQQQRVAIARELVAGAEVLLMDEPLSNLDAQLRIDMRLELKRLHEEMGKTIIYVTHDQIEALTLSSVVAVMRAGKLQQRGSPDEVYFTPRNVFVASFIGNVRINLLPAALEDGHVRGPGFLLPLSDRWDRDSLPSGREIYVGMRPEDIQMADASEPGTIPCVVESVMPMGPVALIQVRVRDADEPRYLTVQRDRDRMWRRDDPVWVRVREEDLHLFDRRTGERLAHMTPEAPPARVRTSAS